MTALRIVERELKVFSRLWHAFAFSTFVMPALFLLAMGVGVGGLVDENRGAVEGVSYLHFVAPGLLMASVMQQAASGSLWPVLGGVKWDGRYKAMVSTPATASDVLLAELVFLAFRTVIASAAFLGIAALLGGLVSPWAVLALPAAVLCAVAFAAPLAAFSITQEADGAFGLIMRLGVMPLFLFSGTFFPVSNLPGWARPLSRLSPLWHAVELARHASLGEAHAADLVHVIVLVAVAAAGWLWGRHTFARRLTA
jgi:lipooligosaccharide transport system permease protein